MLSVRDPLLGGGGRHGILGQDTELWCAAVESKQGCVYCQQCKDFIYDPMLENVRLLQGWFMPELPIPRGLY